LDIFPPELTQGIENLELIAKLNFVIIPVETTENVFKGMNKERRSFFDAFWALFNLENPIYKEVPIYEPQKFISITVPSLREIDSVYMRQLKKSLLDSVEPRFVNWLGTQIQNVSTNIDKYHKDLLDGYEKHLKEARNKVKEETESNIAKWQAMSDEGDKLGELAKNSLRYENKSDLMRSSINLNPEGL
jgi:recombinational DNA repair ATPase RecF